MTWGSTSALGDAVNVIFAIEHPVLFTALAKVANLDIIELLRPLWDTYRFTIIKIKSYRSFETAVDMHDLFCILGNHCA